MYCSRPHDHVALAMVALLAMLSASLVVPSTDLCHVVSGKFSFWPKPSICEEIRVMPTLERHAVVPVVQKHCICDLAFSIYQYGCGSKMLAGRVRENLTLLVLVEHRNLLSVCSTSF